MNEGEGSVESGDRMEVFENFQAYTDRQAAGEVLSGEESQVLFGLRGRLETEFIRIYETDEEDRGNSDKDFFDKLSAHPYFADMKQKRILAKQLRDTFEEKNKRDAEALRRDHAA